MRHSVTFAALIALAGVCIPFMGAFSLPAFILSDIPGGANQWGEDIPEEIACPFLHAQRVLDEKPCDWRPALAPLFRPVVTGCATPREATLAIASRLGELTGVRYDTTRRHPCMNPLEALAEKKVSCTGQSILLVCALRSVGIPARAVGVESWNHIRGNHTWAEAWFEGAWHMVEANESDFNTPWVMEAVGMLDPDVAEQRVLAAAPGGDLLFPTVWSEQPTVAAEDVSPRYQALARQWYAQNGVPEGFCKVMVDAQPRFLMPRAFVLEDDAGHILLRAYLPSSQDDMRQFTSLLLPCGHSFHLRVEGTELRQALPASLQAVRIIRLPGPPR